jgi:ATP-dependent Zn protease
MPGEGRHQGEIPSRGMPSQREIAYHEAGHAVIALGFGESVRRATIKPRAGSRGSGYARRSPMRRNGAVYHPRWTARAEALCAEIELANR